MKKLLLLLIGLYATMTMIAQSHEPCETCLANGIIFSLQYQIDNFHANYPNCTEILGDVTINYGIDITNLNGLNALISIGGNLKIIANLALVNLEGLDNLTSIGGHLDIGYNDALTSITGLENLSSIGGNLGIFHNTSLINLTGLGNVIFIGGHLGIGYNTALVSLTELNRIESIGAALWIVDNDALSNLTGLENVTSIGDDINIYENYSLTSLKGMDSINPTSIQNMDIYDNYSLSECEVLSVCEYLAAPNGTINIYDNASGCNSPEEVQDSCEANTVNIPEPIIAKNLSIYPSPAHSFITIELPTQPSNNTIVSIFDTRGQKHSTQAITDSRTKININNFPAGIYVVQVQDNKGIMTRKVLIN